MEGSRSNVKVDSAILESGGGKTETLKMLAVLGGRLK